MDIKIDLLKAWADKRTFSCNHSPTCRARLVNLMNNVAVLEVVDNPESYMQKYNVEHADKIGTTFRLPAQYAWDAIYF